MVLVARVLIVLLVLVITSKFVRPEIESMVGATVTAFGLCFLVAAAACYLLDRLLGEDLCGPRKAIACSAEPDAALTLPASEDGSGMEHLVPLSELQGSAAEIESSPAGTRLSMIPALADEHDDDHDNVAFRKGILLRSKQLSGAIILAVCILIGVGAFSWPPRTTRAEANARHELAQRIDAIRNRISREPIASTTSLQDARSNMLLEVSGFVRSNRLDPIERAGLRFVLEVLEELDSLCLPDLAMESDHVAWLNLSELTDVAVLEERMATVAKRRLLSLDSAQKLRSLLSSLDDRLIRNGVPAEFHRPLVEKLQSTQRLSRQIYRYTWDAAVSLGIYHIMHLLREEWGNWRYFESTNQIQFASDSARAKYDQLARVLDEARSFGGIADDTPPAP